MPITHADIHTYTRSRMDWGSVGGKSLVSPTGRAAADTISCYM